MKILFQNALLIGRGQADLSVNGKYIEAIADAGTIGKDGFDRVIDCKNRLMMPGLYNCHTHTAMTLFRGYGEDMPLDKWLNDRIFPAEERLTHESVYYGSKLACAEMIRGGIVSFTDMYEKVEDTARVVEETGMKANLTRPILCFDPSENVKADNYRFKEAVESVRNLHNTADGRIRMDMSVHAEYTNTEGSCRAVAEFAVENKLGMHIHLSETEKEHLECQQRHEGRTPARFMADCGIFDVPTIAAHCVYVTDDDMDLMVEKGVTVAHNPSSNLKLGSGIMRTARMLEKGMNIALGTDGAASNNTLSIFKEMYLASLLDKGTTRDPGGRSASQFLRMATVNGAMSQGRPDCGELLPGKRADLILVDLDAIHNIPLYDSLYTALYSASEQDVTLTMCDGKILYENGVFTTIDIEKLKYEMRKTCENYFKKN